jgi:NAD(P)-dependent dehydrogenase (short-subunit alcohol dehydrogenase family)
MSSSIITTSSTPTTSQVWLITGTSSGFGFEMAKHLLAHGDRVIATARKTASIEELGSLGAHVMQLDVTASQEELDKKAKEAWAVYGHIDVLVNNAGYIHFGLMEEVR